MGNTIEIEKDKTLSGELGNYKIVVPDYQRDYAQGRKNDPRIESIRKNFVEDMYKALYKNTPCHTGLVYGSFDGEKFIAVDGQQRLTTVFLFHYYILWRNNELSKHSELKNFKWETRSYSSQFVDLLFNIQYNGETITKSIKENPDYFTIWEMDPTVNSMLEMLEEIEKQYNPNNTNIGNLFTDACPIRFDILKLSKDSDGKTYLKMNSRGRQLTTFENFKAKFIEKKNPDYANKFDNEWANFMLERSQKEDGSFSDPDFCYMNFINEFTFIQNKNAQKDAESQIFIKAKLDMNITDIPYISFNKYDFNDTTKKLLESSLDFIVNNYKIIEDIDAQTRFSGTAFFLDEIIKSNKPEFSHRAQLYALLKYAQLTEYKKIDEGQYRKWYRVIRNLVANTNIDINNIGTICNAIESINDSDIYKYLYNNTISGFDKEQVTEEKEKITQIENNPGWETRIREAEKCAFFKGSIRFLYHNENGEITWNEDFEKKLENCNNFFDPNGVKEEYRKDAKLTKILLSYCNDWEEQIQSWMGKTKHKFIFCQTHQCWKNNILTKGIFQYPVHKLLMGLGINEKLSLKKTDIYREQSFEKLIRTNVITTVPNNHEHEYCVCWSNWADQMCIYRYNARKECHYILLSMAMRDKKINELLRKNIISMGNTKPFEKDEEAYFKGINIGFTYQEFNFTYYFNNTICLMNKDWRKFYKNPNLEDNYDNNATNTLYCVVEVQTEITAELDKLIERYNEIKNQQHPQ